jgi:hypothetical protein
MLALKELLVDPLIRESYYDVHSLPWIFPPKVPNANYRTQNSGSDEVVLLPSLVLRQISDLFFVSHILYPCK